MHRSEFFLYSGCTKVTVGLLSEQNYAMGFLLYQHQGEYFELVMNKLSVDKWAVLVLLNKSIVKGQGKESHTET